MYLTCSRGHHHWGVSGAAGALLVAPAAPGSRQSPPRLPRVLLALRSASVHQGSTWSTPGGAIDPGEDAHAAACREVWEELGLSVTELAVLGQHAFECGGWTYTTVLMLAARATPLAAQGWETDEVRWFDLGEVDRLPTLHASFAASWPALRSLVSARAPDLAASPGDAAQVG